MPKKYAYLEQCRDMHETLSRGIFDLNIGEISGWGSAYSFRSVGKILLDSDVVHIGQKIPEPDSNQPATKRIRVELILGSIISSRCPDLISLLPSFIGWQADETILTEDATIGGTHRVYETSASDELRDTLQQGFSNLKGSKYIITNPELDNSAVFDTSSGERLLDLTPGPLPLEVWREALDYHKDLYEQANTLAENLRFDLAIPVVG